MEQRKFLILDNCNNAETFDTAEEATKAAANYALPDREVVIYQAVRTVKQQTISEPYQS